MCGICGIYRFDTEAVDIRRVERMRDAMTPRGPDDAGASSGPGFALGHRRLAIMDLSAAGHQPMGNEDGSIHIVFNGEIYNFLSLREELLVAGHSFRSRSDTEVLIHGYEEWGLEGLLARIRGFYAFAIVDQKRGSILLARDPLGKKPLFFRLTSGDLAFASSLDALCRGLDCMPPVNPVAVDSLLFNLFIEGPGTILSGVEKLPPGHAASFERTGNGTGRRRMFRHWRPEFTGRTPDRRDPDIREEEWLEAIEERLTAAVRQRLVADVPVGVLLSGGIDSGLVTALAAGLTSRVRTFSVATQDPRLDESAEARVVAEHFGTDHHELPVRANVRDVLTRLVAGMGEPLADSSAVNLFSIASLAREHVTVVLTGDGGDEVFGGYRHFLAYHRAEALRSLIPSPLRSSISRAGTLLRRGPGPIRRAGTLMRLVASPVADTIGGYGYTSATARSKLFTDSFLLQLGDQSPTEGYRRALLETKGGCMVDAAMQAHMLTRLPDDYLAKVDLATMAASLEARNPLLDLDLVELGMRIPAAARFRGGKSKALLRRLAEKHLPGDSAQRRKKGFEAPLNLWITEWADLVDDLILGPHVEARGWFQRATLQRLVNEHRSGQEHGSLLWALLILELWMRLVIDRTLHAGDPLGKEAKAR